MVGSATNIYLLPCTREDEAQQQTPVLWTTRFFFSTGLPGRVRRGGGTQWRSGEETAAG